MRLLADENFPLPSVRLLRAAGIEVASISEQSPGSSDVDVLRQAGEGGGLLITFDRDFGDLIYRHRTHVPTGVVYLRLRPADPEEPARLLLALFARTDVDLSGRFTVMDRDRVRQRPLPPAR